MLRFGLFVIGMAALSGCGLIFQGFHQNVTVHADADSARVMIGDEIKPSPAGFTLRRRPRWRVVQAMAPGKFPACQILKCPHRRLYKVLDLVALILPYAFDAALGTLSHCPDVVNLTMVDRPPGVDPISLPTEREIIRTYGQSRHMIDICKAPYLFDASLGQQAARIVVSSGPIQTDYEILGDVMVNFAGFDRVRGSAVSYGGLAYGSSTREFYQAPMGLVNEAIRRESFARFGDQVDAVINVDYITNPKNDVSAAGVAVRYLRDRE